MIENRFQSALGTDGYFWYGGLKDPIQPPANIDWPLWLGAAQDAPCRPGLIGLQWRSSWDYGTGQLGDWCTHLLDILYFSYDLPSPIAVMAHTLKPSDFYHARGVISTLTYDVSKQKNRAMFARTASSSTTATRARRRRARRSACPRAIGPARPR